MTTKPTIEANKSTGDLTTATEWNTMVLQLDNYVLEVLAGTNADKIPQAALVGAGGPPTGVLGTAAGTGPTGLTIVGTNRSGYVSFTTGTAPAGTNATLITVTFSPAYAVAPKAVLITPKSGYAASIWGGNTTPVINAVPGTGSFVVLGGFTALAASALVEFWYIVS